MLHAEDSGEIGVFIHVCDVDAVRDFAAYVRNIQHAHRLYVSTESEENRRSIENVLQSYGLDGRSDIKVFPGVKNAAGPLIVGFAEELRCHKICLRLHIKTSKQVSPEWSLLWRRHLLDELLGAKDRIDYVLEQFSARDNLGVLRAVPWLGMPHCAPADKIYPEMQKLLRRMGIAFTPEQQVEFPGGSMFWFRSASFGPLLELDLSWDDFKGDNATFALAVERSIFYVASVGGFGWSELPPRRIRSNYTVRERMELVRASGLFDGDYYLKNNPDASRNAVDPLRHFLEQDPNSGQNPNLLFDSSWYFQKNPDAAASGMSALEHFITIGAAKQRSPHPLFDYRWYVEQYPDTKANPLAHYLTFGAFERRNPHPLFDASWYLDQYPDVAQTGMSPLEHYLKIGASKRYNPNPLFHTSWYAAQAPESIRPGNNPLIHFLTVGASAGIDPNPDFNTKAYLEQNPQVAAAGENAILHHLRFGGLPPKPAGKRRLQVFRRGALGDVLLLTPALKALRLKRPDAEIIVTTYYPEPLENNPYIDYIVRNRVPLEGCDETFLMDYELVPDEHIVDAYARFMGVTVSDRTPEIFLRDGERAIAADILREAGVRETDRFCVMQLTTGWAIRNWPIDRFKEVTRALERDGLQVLILGDTKKPEIDFGIDLRGRTSPRVVAAIIEKSAAMITVDSGLMHLGFAFRRPVISLFGCTDPGKRVPDWARPTALFSDISCRGCHHRQLPPALNAPTCIWDTVRCMNDLSAQAVVNAVRNELGHTGRAIEISPTLIAPDDFAGEQLEFVDFENEPSAPEPELTRFNVGVTREQVEQSGLFSALWYLSKYKDVARAKVDPLTHYVEFGATELRSPGPGFDPRWYVRQYPEALSSGLNPLTHFLMVGKPKGYEASGSSYKKWCEAFDALTADDRALIASDIAALETKPVDVVVVVGPANQDFVDETLASIDAQIYPDWRGWISINRRQCSETTIAALQGILSRWPRFRILDDASSQSFLSGGDLANVLLVAAGVTVREHALYMMFRAVCNNAGLNLVYSDEDAIDQARNERASPVFKPHWSPLLLAQTNYIGNCFLIRDNAAELRTFVLGGIAKLEDILHRMAPRLGLKNTTRVPSILFHDRRLEAKETRSIPLLGEEALPGFSIIIPTKDKLDLLQPCVESLVQKTDYPAEKVEIIIVDNDSTEEETLEFLRDLSHSGRAKVIRDDGKFNFSRLNNLAASQSANQVLLLLNNDTIVEDPLWLRRIATLAVEKDVGAIGAKLLYPDRTIQHAGVILGIQGVGAHALVGWDGDDLKIEGDLSREMAAVTGACLAMRREVYDKLGGLDEALAVAFNDTVLCAAALDAGYRNIYVKEPLLIHFESKSRGYDDTPERKAIFQRETRFARRKYNEYFVDDPYYSPNLCLQQIGEFAFPPRKTKPWRKWRRDLKKLKILLLCSNHERGDRVATVVELQARHLRASGHEVYVGGPRAKRAISYPGCKRVYLTGPEDAAIFAVSAGIDCVVAETPPFFSMVRYLADWPRIMCLDHGEPPTELFADASQRPDIAGEKRFCFSLASGVFAISDQVRAESGEERARVIPNANSNLQVWKDSLSSRRDAVRARLGWADKAVVLNACDFGSDCCWLKGVDRYSEILVEFQFARPKLAAGTVFVLCGKGDSDAAAAMRKVGLEVFADATESELAELFLAADVYASFSRWEGYNWGIARALALGLPVIASDIPAHRQLSVFTSDAAMLVVQKLAEFIQNATARAFTGARKPIVADWKESLVELERQIVESCDDGKANALVTEQAAESGIS